MDNFTLLQQPKTNLSIHNAYPPITPSALDAVARRIGRPIPAAYRRFLLEHNGGWPEPGDFCITWADERQEQISVEWFLSVDTQDAIDLEATLKVYQDRIPETLFPVARAGGGGLVCIAAMGEQQDRVFFWDHEEEAEEGTAPAWDNLYPVAESLDAFLAALR